MRRFIAMLVLVVLVLLAGVASATTMRQKETACPVCAKPFTVWVVGSTNTFGGTDSDLCTHAAGESPLSVAIWTCPGCRYSNWQGKTFEAGVKQETAASIRAGLEPRAPIAPDANQLRIPGWVKFDLALRVREMDDATAADLAHLSLSGAWVTRLESDPSGLAADDDPVWKRFQELIEDGPEPTLEGYDFAHALVRAANALLDDAAALRAKGEDATTLELVGASRLRMRGENVRPAAVLTELAAREDAPGRARDAARSLLDSIAHEREFQEIYLRHAARALDENVGTADEIAIRRYQFAETQRRLGRADDAAAAYVRALTGEPPAWLVRVAQRAVADAGLRLPETVESTWRERLDRIVARLRDPEHADDAHEELRFLREPTVLPGVVAALADENETVRRYAARTIRFLPDPRDVAVEALVKVMLEDAGDPERGPSVDAAEALVAIGSPAAAEALVTALEYPAAVRDAAIKGLGLTGDERSVAALLEIRQKNAREVDLALSRLTNRAHADEKAFAAWWNAAPDRTRRDWVVAGFAEAGLAVPKDLWTRDSVPTLIDWLADARPHIRANALRVLREVTGMTFGWNDLPRIYDSPRAQQERRLAIRDWRRWWATQRDGK